MTPTALGFFTTAWRARPTSDERFLTVVTCGATAEFAGNTYTCTLDDHTGMTLHNDELANDGAGQEWPKIAGVPWTGDGAETESDPQ